MKLIEHYIGGKNYSGNSKRKSKVFDPATGEQSAEVKLATTQDVNTAVDNAKKKAALLNFIFEENEIKNKPRQTIIMPPKPYVFIEVDKNIILKRAIKSEEPPLAIG